MGSLRLRFWKPKQSRHLRTYERVAHTEHLCTYCPENIQPGDYYCGNVWVTSQGLRVDKQHVDPPCERPYDEDWDEISEDMRREEEMERQLTALSSAVA